MRSAVVQRVALSACAIFVGASVLFAWRAGIPRARRAAVVEDAAAATFERHCAGCHDAAALARPLHAAADRAAAGAALLAFLAEHGEAGTEEDRAIVDFLLAPAR